MGAFCGLSEGQTVRLFLGGGPRSGARARNRLDPAARPSRHRADLTILRFDKGAGRQIAVEAAEIGGRNLAVRGLRAVLVEDVKKHEAGRAGLLFLGHVLCLRVSRVLLRLGRIGRFAARRLAPRRLLFETLQLLLPLLRLGPVAVRALLVVVRLERHISTPCWRGPRSVATGAACQADSPGPVPLLATACVPLPWRDEARATSPSSASWLHAPAPARA